MELQLIKKLLSARKPFAISKDYCFGNSNRHKYSRIDLKMRSLATCMPPYKLIFWSLRRSRKDFELYFNKIYNFTYIY